MTISQRLIELINNKNVSAYEVSKKTGISEPTMSRILNDKTKKPNVDTIELLAQYFEVNTTWLLTGKGEMLKTKAQDSSDKDKIIALQAKLIEKSDLIAELLQEISNLKEDVEKSKKALADAANARTANVG